MVLATSASLDARRYSRPQHGSDLRAPSDSSKLHSSLTAALRLTPASSSPDSTRDSSAALTLKLQLSPFCGIVIACYAKLNRKSSDKRTNRGEHTSAHKNRATRENNTQATRHKETPACKVHRHTPTVSSHPTQITHKPLHSTTVVTLTPYSFAPDNRRGTTTMRHK